MKRVTNKKATKKNTKPKKMDKPQVKQEPKNKVKKKINWKAIIIALVIILIISIFVIRGTTRVRSIDIELNNGKTESKITKERVEELLGLKIGDKLYKNLRSEISEKIEQDPYIEEAKVERNFAGKLKIIVTERKPTYQVNFAGEFIYIDNEGYVLELNNQNNGTPVILGLSTDFSELSIGKTKIRLNDKDLEKLDIVNNIMSSMKSNGIQNKIYSVDVSQENDFVLGLDDDQKTVHIGDGDDLNTRVLYMKKILEVEAGHSGIIYVNGDLNENYVYFKEQ